MKPLKLKTPNNNQHNPAFTIIEVVLVLAIAGLIFLMVFIALPALQRSQIDTARKNDVSLVAAAVKNWRSNNRGRVLKSEAPLNIRGSAPDSTQLGPYLKDTLSDNTSAVGIYDKNNTSVRYFVGPEDKEGHIVVYVGRKCPSSNTPSANNIYEMQDGVLNDAAIVIVLESGGFYCQDT